MREGMGKQWKRAKSLFCILALTVVSMVGIHTSVLAEATGQTETAGKTTKIYYQNAQNWDKVNVWAWKMSDTSQLVKSEWPGDAAATYDGECEGNWVVYEFQADETFGILFNDGESGDGDQTGDISDLEPGKTYWIVAADTATANDNGYGGGYDLTASTEALAGYPEGPAADTESDTSEETDTSNTMVWVIIGIAVVAVAAGAAVVIVKKKKK